MIVPTFEEGVMYVPVRALMVVPIKLSKSNTMFAYVVFVFVGTFSSKINAG